MDWQKFKTKAHQGKEDKMRLSNTMYRAQRQISIRISWALLKIFPEIKANYISVFNIILLFFILYLSTALSENNAFFIILTQLILLNFTIILDGVDGEIARCKDFITQRGMYYDSMYHFFFPVIFFFITGYFYYILSGNIYIIIGAITLGLLITNDRIFGKLIKHHIKVKIFKEGSRDRVKDYLEEKIKIKQKRPILPFRLINYFVFMIYDWTWCLYVLLIVLAYYIFPLSYYLYIIHLVLSLILVGRKTLVDNPSQSLFRKDDLQ